MTYLVASMETHPNLSPQEQEPHEYTLVLDEKAFLQTVLDSVENRLYRPTVQALQHVISFLVASKFNAGHQRFTCTIEEIEASGYTRNVAERLFGYLKHGFTVESVHSRYQLRNGDGYGSHPYIFSFKEEHVLKKKIRKAKEKIYDVIVKAKQAGVGMAKLSHVYNDDTLKKRTVTGKLRRNAEAMEPALSREAERIAMARHVYDRHEKALLKVMVKQRWFNIREHDLQRIIRSHFEKTVIQQGYSLGQLMYVFQSLSNNKELLSTANVARILASMEPRWETMDGPALNDEMYRLGVLKAGKR